MRAFQDGAELLNENWVLMQCRKGKEVIKKGKELNPKKSRGLVVELKQSNKEGGDER